MKRKTLCMKVPEEIELKFLDGKRYVATFNVKAIGYMQEALEAMSKDQEAISDMRAAGIILYSGIKANHPEFSLDEAEAMIMQMAPSDYREIIDIYAESSGMMTEKTMEETRKKVIAQMLLQIARSSSENYSLI